MQMVSNLEQELDYLSFYKPRLNVRLALISDTILHRRYDGNIVNVLIVLFVMVHLTWGYLEVNNSGRFPKSKRFQIFFVRVLSCKTKVGHWNYLPEQLTE